MRLLKMRLPSGKETVGLFENGKAYPLSMTGGQYQTLADILESDDPPSTAELLADRGAEPIEPANLRLLAPIDKQEVWGAGVTYKRSKTARMEESEGAARFYDMAYEAARPELFFKATPHRVVGPHEPIRIRQDAAWSVPEPELALVLNSKMRLVGFSAANDVTSRDIEGENPLYLPQAKIYDDCCALGPCITLAKGMPRSHDVVIRMTVRRKEQPIFVGETHVGQMARTFEDLVGYLGRENTFPNGVILLTGTGIVPDDDFSLAPGDVVEIIIDGIGTLLNPVTRG
jgi:2-dehydro-3-deoxy-D-arabinonate dehydratase